MSFGSQNVYNPLDKRNLAESVVRSMLTRSDLEPYRPITERNRNDRFEQPLYVGKAIPPGGRVGRFGLSFHQTNVLFARLRQHASSISEAENLVLADSSCRFLVVDDIWIPLAENLLIETFRPLWNVAIDGFGNHDPGRGRYNQRRSAWDTLHTGRSWAARLQPNSRTEAELVQRIRVFLADAVLAQELTEEALRSQDDSGVV